MMKSIVSIITPLFNRSDLVPETWASIQNQSYENWEWIVVDDGSTDGGDAFIRDLALTDPRVQLHHRESLPKGPSHCRNIGTEFAKGEYLIFLDSDDIISHTCLEKRVEFIKQHPKFDFAVFAQATFTTKIKDHEVFGNIYKDKKQYLISFIKDMPPWCISGPIWKTVSFQLIGGFREDYMIMEDPELHIRALMSGLNFEVVETSPDFFYRVLPKTPEQEIAFWKNSILGRITFFKNLYPQMKTVEHKIALQEGIKNLYGTFLLSRIVKFKNVHDDFMNWIKERNLMPKNKMSFIKLYLCISNHRVLNSIPFIKGWLFRNTIN
ncbi:glycosyltransferase family 2 protein [Gelidibacter salicanalis]|uniref:Glycosyltransferase family 2 protein n=1 Tax=Gelidibacter salicanalis TaxID=291193 RepID=A0A5C7AMU6_9FLAO|nr:glycosyltransferase family 2 protein [Gelidibacter salicanalis]TXE09274.1 glycosyltransferase family 2 protein [Gelidibacter salicanalis]